MFRERIEAVTVACGYGDFLAAAMPFNLPHLDGWTVVTTPDDEETRAVCHKYRVHCLVTEDARRDGTFSKGRLLERGLHHVRYNEWVLLLDADVVLPARFRDALARAHPDPACLYGCDRVMVRGWADWQRLLASGWLTGTDWHPHGVAFPPGFAVGGRWAGADGYVPCGFFQLLHRIGGQEEWRGGRAKPFPVGHGTAARGDIQYGMQFDRRKRVLIPELVVAHLESEVCRQGANWKGRTTARFGPPAAGTPAAALGSC